MECLLWYLEGSKRGYYQVNSSQGTNKKLLDTVSELRKTPVLTLPLPLLLPCILFYLNYLAQMLFLFQNFFLLLLSFPQQRRIKKKKIRKDHNSLKEKPATGRIESSSMLTYTPRTQAEFRALAKEFSHPSEDPLGFAKESELTI